MSIKDFIEQTNSYFWKAVEGAEDEYSIIFDGVLADIHIDMWESACLGKYHTLWNEDTLKVIAAYANAGLQIKNSEQPPDFIGFETEFLLILLAKENYKAFTDFWLQHYRPFLLKVIEQIEMAIPNGRYAEIFVAIRNELASIDKEINELPAKCVNENFESELFHFSPLSKEEKEKLFKPQIIRTSGRGNCGGKCVIYAHMVAGCIIKLTTEMEENCEEMEITDQFGNKVSPQIPKKTPALTACVRGIAYRQTFLRSDRLKYPLLRVGKRGEGRFKRISWVEAIDIIEDKLQECTKKYGVGCRYVNYCSGISTVMNPENMMFRLLSLDGGFLGHYLTYSSACAKTAIPMTYGTMEVRNSMVSHYDSELLILWGFNPLVTGHGYETEQMLKYHKRKGTPVIVIDPQFSDTAKLYGTKWLAIRPGTDAALVASLAYVLWTEKLCDQSFMDKFCLGFDSKHMPDGYENAESYYDYVFGLRDGIAKTPGWAAQITGIPEKEILALARLYGTVKPAAIIAGLGPQRTLNGEQTVRSVMVLPCMTGNVGISGGGTACRGSVRQHYSLEFPEIPNPYKGRIPIFMWTEAIRRGREFSKDKERVRNLQQLDSNIKFIFNLAGNTLINQHSDINTTKELLEDEGKVEFIVASDIFMTPSVRYADLVLPGVSMFEEEFIAEPWNEGNYLIYGNKCMEPLFECRSDFDWMKELAIRMGLTDFAEGCNTQEEWLELIYNRLRNKEAELPYFAEFKKQGVYKYKKNTSFVAFKECIEDFEHHKFPTESGKIEIFAKTLLKFNDSENIPPIPKFVPTPEGYTDSLREQYPLQLLGWHSKRRTHSVHDNNELLEKVEPQRLWINPQDANDRGISDESFVKVYNRHGSVLVKARVSDRIMQGVVCLPQGAWYTPDAKGVDLRGSVNVLTHSIPTAWGKCNGQHTALVEVELYKV